MSVAWSSNVKNKHFISQDMLERRHTGKHQKMVFESMVSCRLSYSTDPLMISKLSKS